MLRICPILSSISASHGSWSALMFSIKIRKPKTQIKNMPNMAPSRCIGLGQIAARHRFPHAQMVEFAAVCFERYNEVAKALAVGKLTEHHRK